MDAGSHELWRVGMTDMAGPGHLVGTHTDPPADAGSAVAAAAADQDAAIRQIVGSGPVVSAGEPSPRSGRGLPTVPEEIASWSPRVHSLASQALHGGRSLNAMVADVTDPQARQDRDDLRSALAQLTNRMLGYLPGGPRESAPIGAEVRDARVCLRAGDLDATLQHLASADELRHRLDRSDPGLQDSSEEALRRVLIEAAGRLREQPPAVSNVWRSGMTAAAEVRAQVRDSAEGDLGRAGEPVREEELELLDRVDPAEAQAAREAGGRVDWSHRRPERATGQLPGRRRGRSVDGSD